LTKVPPQRGQILQAFVEAEIFEPVDADLDPEKRAELFVGARHQALAVDAEDVMPVVELFQHGVKLAAEPLVFADAKDLRDDVGRQAKHAQFARAFEDLMDRERAAKDEIAAVMCPPRICGARFDALGWRGGARSGGHISRSLLTTTPARPVEPDHLARPA
jgi:hypothetical protein